MMIIDNKFEIGQTVFLKTDELQSPRIVISIVVCPNNLLQYTLACGEVDDTYYDFEISDKESEIFDVDF